MAVNATRLVTTNCWIVQYVTVICVGLLLVAVTFATDQAQGYSEQYNGILKDANIEIFETYKSSDTEYPELLVYTFKVDSEDVIISLHRTSNFGNNVPVYVSQHGKIGQLNAVHKQSYACYHDNDNEASMVISTVRTSRGQLQRSMTGTFWSLEKHYSLTPNDDNSLETIEDTHNTQRGNSIGSYIIDDITTYGEGLLRDVEYHTKEFLGLTEGNGMFDHKRLKRATSNGRLYVELLIMVDCVIYKRCYDSTNGSTPKIRDANTIAKLQRYYAQVANGINLRYMNLEAQQISIRVILKAIYIARTPAESYWTEASDVKEDASPKPLVNATRALEYIEEWSTNPNITSQLPTFDHAMLITGNNIWRGNSQSGDKLTGVSGSAVTGGMCSPSESISINEDPGAFKTIDTCTHELGHSLGSGHDGSGNACSSADQYIMATTESATTAKTYKNVYQFSSCSVAAIQAHIDKVNRENRNCMANSATNLNNQTAFNILTSVMPGQMYTVHEMCKDMYGTDSFYCGGAERDAKICTEMSCYNPVTSLCEQYSGMKGPRGVTCGDRKWCIESECVCGYDAPRADATCTYGDYLGMVYSDKNTTCADTSKDPGLCYMPYYRNLCCKSCADVYDPCSLSDCRYGNINPACSTYQKSGVCPNSVNWDQCCHLCEDYIAANRSINVATISACRNQTVTVDTSYECENITTTVPPSTTTGPSTTTRQTTTAEPTTTAPSTAASTTTEPDTTTVLTTTIEATTTTPVATTLNIPSTTPYVGTLNYANATVRWSTINGTEAKFTSDLLDPASTQYRLTAYIVCSNVMAWLKDLSFTSIKTCDVGSFKTGSIISEIALGFENAVNPATLESTMKGNPVNLTGSQGTTISVSDINECTSSTTNDCSLYASCSNTDGSYTCTCQAGYDDSSTTIGGTTGRRCSQPCNATSCTSVEAGSCRPRFDGPITCTCNSGYNGTFCENNWNPSTELENWRVLIIAISMGVLGVYLIFTVPYMAYQIHKYRTDGKDPHRRPLGSRSNAGSSRDGSVRSDPRIPSHYIPRLQKQGVSKPTSQYAYDNSAMRMGDGNRPMRIPRPQARTSSDRGTLGGFTLDI